MFSVKQKQQVSEAVQKILRDTNHPEIPRAGEIRFSLHVGEADIFNNSQLDDDGKPILSHHNRNIRIYSHREHDMRFFRLKAAKLCMEINDVEKYFIITSSDPSMEMRVKLKTLVQVDIFISLLINSENRLVSWIR